MEVTLSLDEKTQKSIEIFMAEAGVTNVESALSLLIELYFSLEPSEPIDQKDLAWVKYLTPIMVMSKSLLDNFQKVHPDKEEEKGRLAILLGFSHQLVNSLVVPEQYKITAQQEELFIDACNIFCTIIDGLKFDGTHIEILNRRFGNVFKEIGYVWK